MSITIAQRLALCRQAMQNLGVNACLILSSDPHLSEYLPPRWQGREWLSGFTGSSGTLLVSEQNAALFTDSRYWEQAQAELQGSGIELVKLQSAAIPAYAQWLSNIKTSSKSPVIAIDKHVLACSMTNALRDAFTSIDWQISFDIDVLNPIWTDRPALPNAPVYEHQLPHACIGRASKLAQVCQYMQKQRATHHWLSSLDDIAWLLNLRGSDVDYNPLFLAHALMDAKQLQLFVVPGKINATLTALLQEDGVIIHDYAAAGPSLAGLPEGSRLLIDPKRVTLGMREHVPPHVQVIEQINPSTLLKSCKTDQEALFVRQAMAHDGAAMCEFYAWLEQALGQELVTELTVDEQLTRARAKQPDFIGLSFPTIAGFNANGALPHYRATEQSFATLSTPHGLTATGLLLIDSGAQYLGGTTDITRVWAVGEPSAAQKRDYTLVLKGTIALSRTRFPLGTLAPMLDAIARAPLWENGLDFGHGTGHGVGYFLNVHEGPQSISKAIPHADMAMQAGMITSIEPGLYRPKQWGIRIENLVLNVPVPPSVPDAQADEPEYGHYLAFETLSLCPIDTRCIDTSLLRPDELAWLNNYHLEVLQRLSPLVSGDAKTWLEKRTQPLNLL